MIDPAAMTTLTAVSRSNARRCPDKLCHRFEGRDTTFAEFDAHVDRVARGLDKVGAKVVAYLGKNCDHVFEVYMGAARIGAVFAPINWRLAPPEVAEIVERFQPDILFVGPEFHAEVEAIRARLPAGMPVVAMEGGHPDWPAYVDWRDANPADPVEDRATPDSVVMILFTSGTTGLPKGVALKHSNLLLQRLDTMPERLPYDHWSEDDVSLVAMPLAHIGGIGWWNLGFINGASAVITREFNPFEVLGYIERERVSKLFIVPAALQILVRDPRAKEADFSRIKLICYGAAPMPEALLREASELIQCGFAQCYGLTETTGTICILRPEEHALPGKLRSAGRAMPGSEIKVVGPDGATLPPGEIGEVAIRGATVMRDYWGNPEATAKVLGADGWFLSGDAGYMDEDGFLYIHDRIKDMIVSGAENVYPAEVENAIHGHPDVADVAVIGVPDEKWGEAVKAIVTARPGHTVDPASVIAWTRERLAHFKCPKTVDVIDAMPRNASGKLLKRELRKPYWEGRARQVN